MIAKNARQIGKSRSASKPRGTLAQPENRFASTSLEPDPDWTEEEVCSPLTQIISDHSETVISYNESPDLGYSASLNPYRGCEHGCVYCYARPTHEYLGYSAGLDFETRILVKERAPELLRRELASARWKPQTLALSGVTDPYQPIERRLQLTRHCLAVLAECRNPVSIVTKNRLVARDLDLLRELAAHQAVAVCISLPTLDAELRRVMEPRSSPPQIRLEVIAFLAGAGLPVGVLVAPVIPGLTDHEIPVILTQAAKAGARFAGYSLLRLPFAVAPLFEAWISRHFPDRKEKVLNRLRAMHGGELYDGRFGRRMRGEGILADQTEALFKVARRKAGLGEDWPELAVAAFRRPRGSQLELFD
jgi:DNA repair photolyase